MSLFLFIVAFVLFSEVLFWRWADRRLRATRRPRLWRTSLHLYMAFQSAGFLMIFAQRALGIVANLPTLYLAAIYLWHILILPATTLSLAIGYGTAALRRRRPTLAPEPSAETSGLPTRRQMLLAGATAVPPILTGVSVGFAISQLDNFRVREFEIPLRALPPDLDGMTIAHVSDAHVGRFTYGRKLRNIADVTNSLRADLICLTGDLIDYSLSDLPAALDMVARMDPRSGLFMCQGNHDLFQSAAAFNARVQAAGVPLLVNESVHITVRGRPVQIFGTRWAQHGEAGAYAGIYEFIPALASLRDPEAFPILMAHHPDSFDPARESGFPLTLSGHSHGGQLMLTDHIGVGPLFYRYYSGLYRNGDAASVVSNGVGNWFPLRTHAPAEIVKITLRHQA